MLKRRFLAIAIGFFLSGMFSHLCAQNERNAVADSILSELQKPHYEWISYQLKVDVKTEDEQLAFQCFFVNRTDSLMYFNLHKSGIELARVVLTPDSVIFVNKLSNEFYRGGYEFLNALFGFPLDFEMAQSVLNARDFPTFDRNLQLSEDGARTILVSPLRQNAAKTCSLMQQIDLAADGHLMVNDVTDLKSMMNVEVAYDGWRSVENVSVPVDFFSKLKVEIDSEETVLDAEIKNVKVNQPGPTAIRIPDSFNEIRLSKSE